MASLVINQAEYEDLQREIGELEHLNSPDLTLPYLAFMCGKVVATFYRMGTEPYEHFGGKVESWGAKFEASARVAPVEPPRRRPGWVSITHFPDSEVACEREDIMVPCAPVTDGRYAVSSEGTLFWCCEDHAHKAEEAAEYLFLPVLWEQTEAVHLTDEADLQRTPQSMMEESEEPESAVATSELFEDFEELLSPELAPLSPEPAVELPEEPEVEPAFSLPTSNDVTEVKVAEVIARSEPASAPSASEALAAVAAGLAACEVCGRDTWTGPAHRRAHMLNHESQPVAIDAGPCQHRWALDRPVGDIVPGKCSRCGETKEFPAELGPKDARYGRKASK